VLDGDNIRFGLNKNLGFSEEDRKENIRRISEVVKLFVDNGQAVLTAFISPFQEARNRVRQLVEQKGFVEVYVKCLLVKYEKRDQKGLYQRARNGEIKKFAGTDSLYEEPVNLELVIETNRYSVEECIVQVITCLEKAQLI